jgi:hypothetical protein
VVERRLSAERGWIAEPPEHLLRQQRQRAHSRRRGITRRTELAVPISGPGTSQHRWGGPSGFIAMLLPLHPCAHPPGEGIFVGRDLVRALRKAAE